MNRNSPGQNSSRVFIKSTNGKARTSDPVLRLGDAQRSFDCGTTIVEAALVTMGFLVLVFGLMEAGRFMSVQQTLTDAAREGARLAVAPASQTSTLPSNTDIQARIGYFLQANGIPVGGGNGATISIDRSITIGGNPDRFTRATVTYAYPLISSLGLFTHLRVNLRATSRMRDETSP